MQPETQQQNSYTSEQLPMPPSVGPEVIPSIPAIEVQPIQAAEAYEQRADAAGVAAQNAGAPAQVAQPVAPQAPAPAAVPVQAVTAPIVAADEELIEKEWVDKAKEIIQRTTGDPHARTEQVSQLQRSYLEKRYGKVIGVDT